MPTKADKPRKAKAAAAPAATVREQMMPPEFERQLCGPALPTKNINAGRLAVTAPFATAGAIAPLQKNLAGDDATAEAIMFGLAEQIRMVRAGNLSEVEAMLVSQAVGLQTQWASLSRKAVHQDYMPHFQTYMTLALKAQAQSRATLEALIELKHPRHPPTFVKQANIAHGPQQVNNGTDAQPSRTEEAAAAPSKLLDANPSPTLPLGEAHERLDSRTPPAAG